MIFIGDIHGKFQELIDKINRYDIKEQYLISIGDFGIGFNISDEKNIEILNNILKDTNNKLLVLRGNHDNPCYFNGYEFKSNIVFLKDYSELEIENKKVLLIGGGISIDRKDRIENSSYWKDEEIIYDEEKIKILSEKKFDILITHVPNPRIFNGLLNPNIVNDWIKKDINLIESLSKEKNTLELFNEFLNFNIWIAGHYHYRYKIKKDNKEYLILDELEFFEF